MTTIKYVLSLLKPGILPIFPKSVKRHWKIALTILLVMLFVISEIYDLCLSQSFSNLALPALSVLTALIFTAIFTVPAQLSQKLKEYEDEEDEGTVNFLITYRNFIQSFSRQLTSLVLLSILIIGFILLNNLVSSSILLHAICAILILGSICFFVLFVTVVINIARMIEENIRFSTKEIEKKQVNLDD